MTRSRLFILGGYGRAGRAVGRLIARRRDWRVTCAGRTPSKAERWVDQLQEDEAVEGRFDWAAVDVDRPADLTDQLREVDALLVALPFQGERSRVEHIVDAAIQTGTDYLDIIPDPEKWPAFRTREAAAQEGGVRLLTEGGVVPGIPSALVRRDLDRFDAVEETKLACVMRDPTMGHGGMHDIVAHLADPAFKIEDGRRVSVGVADAETLEFGPPYGDLLTIPSWLRELDVFEDAEGIGQLRFQQAGMHPVLDGWLGLLMATGLAKTRAGVGFGTRVAERLNRWLAPGPSGLTLQCATRGCIDGQPRCRRTRLFHSDVYGATAAATVAALDQLLTGSIPVGIDYMGHAVDPEAMLDAMEYLGMQVTQSEGGQ